MKKIILLFALVGIMVFTLSLNTLGASQVYVDYILDGEYANGDLSGFNLGLDYKADSFKFGIDCILNGEVENITDYSQIILKVGYGVSENFFITLSMFDNENKIPFNYGEESYNAFILGADLSYDLSEQLTFEGSFGISLTGECDYSSPILGSGNPDIDLTSINLKLIYDVSDNIGIAFGYNDISIDFENGGSFDINYLTLGAAYKF